MKIKIYLAGPEIFFPNRDERALQLKEICAANNLIGLFPSDSYPQHPAADKRLLARQIYDGDVGLIDQAHGLIANMTPFRGLSLDAGTAYEIGYAVAQGKPVFGWSADRERSYFERAQTSANRDDMELEDFTLTDNLMVVCPMVDYQVHDNFESVAAAANKFFHKRSS